MTGSTTKAFDSFHGVFSPTVTRKRLLMTLAVLFMTAATLGGVFFGVAQAQDADGAVNGLTLSSDSPSELTVSWDTPSPGPTDYRIDWAKSGENYQSYKVDEGHLYPEGTATSATITDLEAGVEYQVRLRARYHDGEHADPPLERPLGRGEAGRGRRTGADAGTHPEAGDGTVTGLTLTSATAGSLTMEWNTPNPAPDSYRVMWAEQELSFLSHKNDYETDRGNEYPGGDAISLTLSGLAKGDTFKVRARSRHDSGGENGGPWSGPWTDVASARVMDDPPNAPTELSTSSVAHDRVSLTWTAPDNNAISGYRILRGADANSLSAIAEDTGSTSTTYTDDTVAAETTYVYALLAVSSDGNGAKATLSVTTTVPPPPVPSAPSELTMVPSHDRVTLSWRDPWDDSITGYQVWRGADAANLASIVADTGSATASYVDDTVDAETDYVYAVSAINKTGASEKSATVSTTTTAAPARGELPSLTATAQQPGTFTVSWEQPDPEPEDYRVQWALDGEDFASHEDTTTNVYPTSTSHTFTEMTEGATYKIRARARYRSQEWSGPWKHAIVTAMAARQDLPDDDSTTATVPVGGHLDSAIEEEGDVDWVAMTLQTDKVYQVDVLGPRRTHGKKENPEQFSRVWDTRILRVIRPNGTAVPESGDEHSGAFLDARVFILPENAGEHHVEVSADYTWTGDYRVTVTDVTDSYVDDYLPNTRTTGAVSVTTNASGTIERDGDRDWFSITLEAGKTYKATATGKGENPLDRPELLRIYESETQSLPVFFDRAVSSRQFAVQTDGTYYVAVSGSRLRGTTGDYSLGIADDTQGVNDDYYVGTTQAGTLGLDTAKSGRLHYLDDHDWLSIELTAATYTVTTRRTSGDVIIPYVYAVYDAVGNKTKNGAVAYTYTFKVTSAGTYYIAITGAPMFYNAKSAEYEVTIAKN